VRFSSSAQAQMEWIAARCTTVQLRERIEATLKLGPQPHPYRRIRRGRDGTLVLAVQDWRIDFRVDGAAIEVLCVRSGYRPSELDRSGGGPGPLHLHREFRARFG
jgi:hypothetical protein